MQIFLLTPQWNQNNRLQKYKKNKKKQILKIEEAGITQRM